MNSPFNRGWQYLIAIALNDQRIFQIAMHGTNTDIKKRLGLPNYETHDTNWWPWEDL